ncbi:MAG: hypothetical protein ACD_8C00106G0006 [uncultured bacterium]|nr:MAG: hypothetical protein ACD_8C00106G0006 [uncultured bacterium]
MLKKEEYLKTVKRFYPQFFNTLITISYNDKKYYKGLLKRDYRISNMAVVKNVWYYGLAELEAGGKLTLESWQNPEIFARVKKEFKSREKALEKSATKSIEHFIEAYLNYMPALILFFIIDQPIDKAIRKALAEKLDQAQVDELMYELNTPLTDNIYKQEEYDLVFTKNIKQHVEHYLFLNARFGSEKKYTVKEAENKLKKIDKAIFLKNKQEEKKELRKTISRVKKMLGKDAILVDIFQYIIYYRTHRTDIMNKSAFFAIPMFKKVAKELGLTYEQFLNCSAEEILSREIPTRKIINSRIQDCSLLLADEKVSLFIGPESERLKNFFEEKYDEVEEIRGQIACKGFIEGTARIIHNPRDYRKIKVGDVLVAGMTTPNMIPIMKKASAFVTDEGGVTCHAAIIARELNKPCIIGTKIATKVLKDGDFVEVDADKEVVKILKKK